MDTTKETMWKIYDTINEWIRFSDAKAGAILATNGVIAAAFWGDPSGLRDFLYKHPVFFIPLLAGVVIMCISIYFSLRCLSPTLKIGEPTSLIFFAHVAQKYKTPVEYEQVAKKVFGDDEQATTQIAQQVWANSKVARKKYEAVAWAIRFLVLAVLISIMGLLAAVSL